LVDSFLLEKPSGRANNFPPKWRGLGHVTPKFVANDLKYLKIIWATDFKFGQLLRMWNADWMHK